MNKICKKCSNYISEGRLKALPKAETCVDCSDIKKKKGLKIVTDGVSYTDLEIDKIFKSYQ